MRFVGKNSVATGKKIETQATRNGSQLFEELLSHPSFIHLVELFVTPGPPGSLQLNPCDENITV